MKLRRRRVQTHTLEKKPKDYNSIVLYPPEEGGIKFENVYKAPGQTWRHDNKFVHLLVKTKAGLEAFEPPQEVKSLPDKLYRAFHWESAKRLLAYKATLLDKLNMGLGVAIVGILAFMIFIIMNS